MQNLRFRDPFRSRETVNDAKFNTHGADKDLTLVLIHDTHLIFINLYSVRDLKLFQRLF